MFFEWGRILIIPTTLVTMQRHWMRITSSSVFFKMLTDIAQIFNGNFFQTARANEHFNIARKHVIWIIKTTLRQMRFTYSRQIVFTWELAKVRAVTREEMRSQFFPLQGAGRRREGASCGKGGKEVPNFFSPAGRGEDEGSGERDFLVNNSGIYSFFS